MTFAEHAQAARRLNDQQNLTALNVALDVAMRRRYFTLGAMRLNAIRIVLNFDLKRATLAARRGQYLGERK